jgi:hypothetical protein
VQCDEARVRVYRPGHSNDECLRLHSRRFTVVREPHIVTALCYMSRLLHAVLRICASWEAKLGIQISFIEELLRTCHDCATVLQTQPWSDATWKCFSFVPVETWTLGSVV